jgi:hypothetical protein
MEAEMATKWGTQPGHANKHNADYGYVQDRKVVEESKWGWAKARERYGSPRQEDMRPKDQSQPQRLGDSGNLTDTKHGYPSDSKMDWKRGANEDATTMPNFDRVPTGGRR